MFLFSTKYIPSLKSLSTYGSQLSSLSFRTNRVKLYFATILGFYFSKKISHYFFNRSNFNANDKWFKFYRRILIIYKILDFSNMVQFISVSPENSEKTYFISILHRVLNISPISLTKDKSSFISNIINSGIEYQNRQLLWNTILEFLNLTIIPNMITIFNKNDLSRNHLYSNQTASTDQCPLCLEYPVNPYKITCCDHAYCYLCILKAINNNKCYHCQTKSKQLKGRPFFQVPNEKETINLNKLE